MWPDENPLDLRGEFIPILFRHGTAELCRSDEYLGLPEWMCGFMSATEAGRTPGERSIVTVHPASVPTVPQGKPQFAVFARIPIADRRKQKADESDRGSADIFISPVGDTFLSQRTVPFQEVFSQPIPRRNPLRHNQDKAAEGELRPGQ